MMNVSLHHRGVDPQLRAILQSKIDCRLNNQIIDGFEWVQLLRGTVPSAVHNFFGHADVMN